LLEEFKVSELVSRLAPTPNGELHFGNLFNFILTWSHIRKNSGKLWLRFDDIDQSRCESRYIDECKELLKYIGIDWDEESLNQFGRIDEYRLALESVPNYACDCSRKEIKERTQTHFYDGHCLKRNLKYMAGENTIRFKNPNKQQEDFVLWRKEDIPAYHLTSVVDDLRMGVNLIVRGADLLDSSLAQLELYKVLNDHAPEEWSIHHHQLLLNADGEKLSKSRKDGELFKLMKENISAQSILQEMAKRAGLDESKFKNINNFLDLRLEDFSKELQSN
tara:strand:+ start:6539 stop:7369 length:831 start_codon:yes stop_codon:yes gene_type:complete